MSPEAVQRLKEISETVDQIVKLQEKLHALLGIDAPLASFTAPGTQPQTAKTNKQPKEKAPGKPKKREPKCSHCSQPGHQYRTCPTRAPHTYPTDAKKYGEPKNDDQITDEELDTAIENITDEDVGPDHDNEPLNIEQFFKVKDLFKQGDMSKDIAERLDVPLREVNQALQFTKFSSYLARRI